MGLRAHEPYYPQSANEESDVQGSQWLDVCSQALYLPLQIECSPQDTTLLPDQPECSKVSPDLAQREQIIQSIIFKLRSTTLRSRARQGSRTEGTKINNISSHRIRNSLSSQGGMTCMQVTVTCSVQSKTRPAGRGASPAGGNKLEGWQ